VGNGGHAGVSSSARPIKPGGARHNPKTGPPRDAQQLSRPLATTTLATAIAAFSLPAGAGDLADRFDVHGYGFQTYAQTSDNAYLGADKRGTWDNNSSASSSPRP